MSTIGPGSAAAFANADAMSCRWYFPPKYLKKNPKEALAAFSPCFIASPFWKVSGVFFRI